MTIELVNKITILKELLEKRNNKSFVFFNKLLDELSNGFVNEAVDSIVTSYAIVQYGNFTYQEETLFSEIWNIAKKIENK